ncbi:MAG TPA: hypothetical protein V6D08_18700 [Candidatus Obscuribacterales bacterium]
MLPDVDFMTPQVEQPRQEERRTECAQRAPALDFIEIVRGRRQERQERKQERKTEKEQSGEKQPDKRANEHRSSALKGVGGIEKLPLPDGYVKEEPDPESFRKLTRLHLTAAPAVRIGHETCIYRPHEQVDSRLRALLKEPPHRLTARQVDEIASAIPNALYGSNGDLTLISMQTADISGKRVLIMESRFNTEDRHVYGIFANPDRKQETLDSIWFEAPEKDYKQHCADALASFRAIKWKGTAAATPLQRFPLLLSRP